MSNTAVTAVYYSQQSRFTADHQALQRRIYSCLLGAAEAVWRRLAFFGIICIFVLCAQT